MLNTYYFGPLRSLIGLQHIKAGMFEATTPSDEKPSSSMINDDLQTLTSTHVNVSCDVIGKMTRNCHSERKLYFSRRRDINQQVHEHVPLHTTARISEHRPNYRNMTRVMRS